VEENIMVIKKGDWKTEEEKVTQTARDIARFLWNLGYRLKK